ncbi:MAG: hypothetical protein AAF226_00555 [Verrucomicrobiota bacterium]
MKGHAIWLVGIIALGISFANSAEIHPQIQRLMAMAEAQEGWEEQKTLSGKMWKLREAIMPLGIASDPVSDRYLITKLGGPIDWVHFLALAAQTCSGKHSLEEALMIQWKAEGGPDHEKGLSRTYYPEAHPDDLPSNAFGALFGREMMKFQSQPEVGLGMKLHQFLAPLLPVEDALAQSFSHRYIVMGLSDGASRDVVLSRSEWFTAEPLFVLTPLDPALRREVTSARAALNRAGFEVFLIEGRPIGIRRLKK